METLFYHAYCNKCRSYKVESSSTAVKIGPLCLYFSHMSTCMLHVCVWVCARLCVCTLTVDLQYFSCLLWCLCECHMVHFAGVGHSVIISVHMQLQRAPYRKCLPTCIHLFVTFGKSCILSQIQHIYLVRCDGATHQHHAPAFNSSVKLCFTNATSYWL